MHSNNTDFFNRLFIGWTYRGIVFATGIVFTLVMAALFVFQPFFLKTVELKVYDAMFRATYSEQVPADIVIVDLDEESLAAFGQWPWPRYRVAMLLEKIRRAGAVSIGLDMVFAEKDRTSPKIIKKQLQNELGVLVHFAGLPPGLEDNDAILAGILEQGPFSLGYYFEMQDRKYRSQKASTGPIKLHPLQAAILGKSGAIPLHKALFRADGVVGNIPVLSNAVMGSGFMNVTPDSDGIVRRVPLLIDYNEKFYPCLALAVLLNILDSKQVVIRTTSGGVESLKLGNHLLPLDSRGNLLLNYRGPGRTVEYISAGDILNDAYDPVMLERKIVFVGTSAAGLKDIRATPLDQVYPGVEAQATIVDNILNGDYLYRPDWGLGLELFLVVAIGLLSTVFLVFMGGIWLIVPLGLFAGSLWLGALHLLETEGAYISPFMPLLALTGNFSLLTFQKFWIEEREKRKIKSTFEHYLSPKVIKRVMKNPELLKLGGEKKNLSILFTDIRNFTSISESMEPQELVGFMNEFLTAMTDTILRNGGTLDKFMGDAIMAFFGAPEDMPDHARIANIAALEMFEALYGCREKWLSQGLSRIEVGIGISSGDVIVGNMGSENRFNYTVMGDPVNLASRLEGLTKLYGVKTLISQYTREQIGDDVTCREIDRVRVKGKEKPVAIYEPFGKDYFTQGRFDFIRPFEQGLAQYRSRNWAAAISRFEDVLAIKPSDNPSLIYIERCRKMAQSPPGPDWDGVLIMDKK